MNMHFDHAAEILGDGTELTKSIKNHSINWNVSKPYSHWKDWADDGIELIKLIRKSTMKRTVFSPRLWDYGMKPNAELPSQIFPKDGSPPLEKLTGDTELICV